MKRSILVIEQSEEIGQGIRDYFENEHTRVCQVPQLVDGIKEMSRCDYDMIVLGLLLSMKGGGNAVVAAMRNFHSMPLLVLAKDASVSERILALQYGADAVLSHPYDMNECVAWVQALMRRNTELNPQERRSYGLVSHHGLMLNATNRTVFKENIPVDLTRTEFDLFWLFMRNKNRVLTYEQIYEAIWPDPYLGDNATIQTHVWRLRKKLGMENLIESVHQVGYRMRSMKEA